MAKRSFSSSSSEVGICACSYFEISLGCENLLETDLCARKRGISEDFRNHSSRTSGDEKVASALQADGLAIQSRTTPSQPSITTLFSQDGDEAGLNAYVATYVRM